MPNVLRIGLCDCEWDDDTDYYFDEIVINYEL